MQALHPHRALLATIARNHRVSRLPGAARLPPPRPFCLGASRTTSCYIPETERAVRRIAKRIARKLRRAVMGGSTLGVMVNWSRAVARGVD